MKTEVLLPVGQVPHIWMMCGSPHCLTSLHQQCSEWFLSRHVQIMCPVEGWDDVRAHPMGWGKWANTNVQTVIGQELWKETGPNLTARTVASLRSSKALCLCWGGRGTAQQLTTCRASWGGTISCCPLFPVLILLHPTHCQILISGCWYLPPHCVLLPQSNPCLV